MTLPQIEGDLTPEEEIAYLEQNPDVAAAIARQQVGAEGPKWEGSVSDHYRHAHATGEARYANKESVPVEEEESIPPAPFTTLQLQQLRDNTPISVGGGSSTHITQVGPEIDYGRIQGFVGVPEIRDEEGNITQQATGIYAQQPTGLMAAQEATQQAIGQAAVDPDTGEVIQPATLFEGQSALGAGQAQLGTQLGAGQAGLMAGQQTLGEGQATLGQAIGVPDEQQPATLFGGQMALGQGQAGIQTGVTGLGRDIGTLTGNISDFERMQRAYQTRAEGQRAQGREIGMTTREQLEDQLRTVGSQTNRIAEQQAQQRQRSMMGPRPQAQQAPMIPQAQQATQAAQIAGQNLRNFAPQQGGMMGPTGPTAIDPRDQVGFGPTRSPV